MRRDDLRYNRKTKAAAVACFASCLIRPVKGFEYVGGLSGGLRGRHPDT